MTPFADFEAEIYQAGGAGATPSLPMTSEGFELAAARSMTPQSYAYVAGSAGLESTARANRVAFDGWETVPRHLRGIAQRDLSLELFGTRLPAPVLLAPIGALCTIREGAEMETARVAAETGVPMILSTLSSSPLEEVAAALAAGPAGVGWFQLYWPTDRELAASLVQRADRAGYHALVVTIDTGSLAWRPRDLANGYLPFLTGQGLANYFSDPVFRARLSSPPERDPASAVALWSKIFSNPGLRWADLQWLRSQTSLPILVKGVCHPDDAREAIAAGLDGIIVSNHGGRQVDGARAALDCLPEVADASGNLTVLFDSGVRCGSDVLKALALGAKAILLGRPYVFGLAVAGEDGLRHVLRCLLAELDLTVGLSGHASLADLGPGSVRRRAGGAPAAR